MVVNSKGIPYPRWPNKNQVYKDLYQICPQFYEFPVDFNDFRLVLAVAGDGQSDLLEVPVPFLVKVSGGG